jgi:hypothetical protein
LLKSQSNAEELNGRYRGLFQRPRLQTANAILPEPPANADMEMRELVKVNGCLDL